MLNALIVSLLLSASAPGGLLSDPKADALFSEAQLAFEEERYGDAASLLERAYLIEPVPALLYPWAQAERSQGNCDVAVDLYQQFLDSGVEGSTAEAAQKNIARCEEEMAAAVPPPIVDEPVEDDGTDDLDDIVGAEPEPEPEPEPVKPVDDEPRKTKAWYKDPAGGVLVGLGVAGVATGTALLVVASGAAADAPDAGTHDDYLGERDRATSLRNGGAAALSIGSALLLGGIIRYVVVAKKNKKTSATAWYDGRSGGFALTGRF